ncbi:GNAT family N-acetyltransferase [Vibrio parahaemolyticus]|uniref:GNAT family N-acetyltransferase n=1 Tax=Vibrio parahaemolyticus TaxID=670 RepID=UPI000446BD64|nr:GNAT family N-acetyltransferase [Vibrio parahaemolyticus]EHH2512951.1 N-acetyltransferase [Vibrio parahaemolyticus]ELA9296163.1 N-acetyltransferase [Vibrio parahaemolyticus]EXJ28219.1 acetyltransferase family protein [Vibrio parahaemolyticus VPTS-2009]TOF08542.1 N-acetyltransferase [Vibrio parahaemolyticus]
MHKVIHDTESGLFWVDLEQDFKAKVVYELKNDVMHITSTVVPEELRGKGYGKVMMEAVLPEIEALDYKIEPVCPYVAHYINRTQAWLHLLA